MQTIEKEIVVDVIANPGDAFYESVLSDFLDEQNIKHDFRKPLQNNIVAELKPYQERYLGIWKSHWINIGLCTKPTDKDKAEQYFCDFYKELGFSKPKSIVWFDNPIKMYQQANKLKLKAYNQVYYEFWGRLTNPVWNNMREQIKNKTKINQPYSQLWSRIYSQIWDLARDHTWHGQHDAHWLIYYSYMMQVLRLELPKVFTPMILLSHDVNLWIPTEKIVYVTRKPKKIVVKNNKFIKMVYQDECVIA
jgi:hypothetical protein